MFCFVLVWVFCFCFCFVFWLFFFFFFWWEGVKNIHEISRFVRCKNREKYAPKKTIIQDNIYFVRQFAYINRVVVISLFTREKKIQEVVVQFSLSQKNTTNPNLKQQYFLSCIEDSQWAKKQYNFFYLKRTPHTSASAWAYRPKPLLHGLSLAQKIFH